MLPRLDDARRHLGTVLAVCVGSEALAAVDRVAPAAAPGDEGRRVAVAGCRGAVPRCLGHAAGLRALDVSACALFGVVPWEVLALLLRGTCKVHLNKYGAGARSNRLFLPRRDGGWRGFRDLAAIDLSNQGLAGPVPPALPRLAAGRLRDLDLTLNRFRGDCPRDLLRARLAHGCAVHLDESSRLGPAALDSLGELPDLARADASSLSLAGAAPRAALAGLARVVDVDLSYNALAGFLPSPLPATLATFRFSNNAFEGDLRAVAPLCAPGGALRRLDARYNRLGGALPPALLALRHGGRGADVRLGGNLGFEIDGAGGAALAAAPPADVLDLRDCALAGPLPAALGELPPRVRVLALGGNRLDEKLGAAASLAVLRLLARGCRVDGARFEPRGTQIFKLTSM